MQFITNILEAKKAADGSFLSIDAGTLSNANVVANGDPVTGKVSLVLGKGATGLKGQYYAANFDTINKRYTGQLYAIPPFQVEGTPDFDPKVDVTNDGIEVSNASSAASASDSAANDASSASAKSNA